ncbi:hypothetical protein D3C72_1801130 [compost metagenome]
MDRYPGMDGVADEDGPREAHVAEGNGARHQAPCQSGRTDAACQPQQQDAVDGTHAIWRGFGIRLVHVQWLHAIGQRAEQEAIGLRDGLADSMPAGAADDKVLEVAAGRGV